MDALKGLPGPHIKEFLPGCLLVSMHRALPYLVTGPTRPCIPVPAKLFGNRTSKRQDKSMQD